MLTPEDLEQMARDGYVSAGTASFRLLLSTHSHAASVTWLAYRR